MKKSDEEINNHKEDLITKSLVKVGKSTGIILIGSILGVVFNLIRALIVVFFYTPEEYGLFNLYFTILTIFTVIGSVGLSEGIQRNLSYFIGKKEKKLARSVVIWGLIMGTIGGIVSGAILFLFSNSIAGLLTNDPRLIYYFKVASIALPFNILTTLFISIFRGFQRTKEIVFFQQIIINILILVPIVFISIFYLPFQNIIHSVSLAIVMNFLIFLIYSLYSLNKKKKLEYIGNTKLNLNIGKKLFIFSFPILFVMIMNNIIEWGDTIIIGYYLPESSIAFYQASIMMCRLISTTLTATIVIYTPLVTALYAQNRFEINKKIYVIVTKWLCFSTLPITLIFFLYSKELIIFLFGVNYIKAVIPLQILSIAYFYNNLMGPNGATLTAYGKTKSLMYATGIAGLLNITLNIILIPFFDIIGAAVATSFSIFIVNLIRTLILKKISGIHPIAPEIIKPTSLSILLSLILYFIFRLIIPISLFLIIISTISFYFIFFLSLILTRSISREDIKIILIFERKLGVDLTKLKKIVKRFI